MKNKIMTRVMLWFLWTVIVIAFGYYWHYQALAYTECMNTVQPAGWVASDRIDAAMDKMGPRYNYRMGGETLYVNRGDGQWLRLKY